MGNANPAALCTRAVEVKVQSCHATLSFRIKYSTQVIISTDKQLVGAFKSQFEAMSQVHTIVSSDMGELYGALMNCSETQGMQHMQYLLRNFIRVLFAMTEANAWQMKQLAWKAPVPGLSFAPDELEKITEIKAKTKADGTPRIRHLNTLENLEFGFEIMAKAFDVPSTLDLNHPGHAAMERANARRNRMVHPKSVDDLIMNQSDLESTVEAFQWYLAAFKAMNDRCGISLNEAMRRQGILAGQEEIA